MNDDSTSVHSSFYEKLVEHAFISEILQEAWFKFGYIVDVMRSEVDASGYDLALECNGRMRHVQLKTSHSSAKASFQKVNSRLWARIGGCVVWIRRSETPRGRIELSYLFFGGDPSEPLPPIEQFKVAKHSKANSQGVKAERPGIRKIPKTRFKVVNSASELLHILFGLGFLPIHGESPRASESEGDIEGSIVFSPPSADALSKVLSFVSYFESMPTDLTEIGGGDESPSGLIQMPFVRYSSELGEFIEALYEAGLVQSFDWTRWQGEATRYLEDPSLLRYADIDVLIKLFTTHARKDHFCEGHLGEMARNGHITTLLHRLRDLHRAMV